MQNDVSQIPKLVEEISMLKLQIKTLARTGSQDNVLIQRFLDDTATYAESEYDDTISNMNDVASIKREDSTRFASLSVDGTPRPYNPFTPKIEGGGPSGVTGYDIPLKQTANELGTKHERRIIPQSSTLKNHSMYPVRGVETLSSSSRQVNVGKVPTNLGREMSETLVSCTQRICLI
jgi:hypothetical protein